MRVERLELSSFRSYAHARVDLDPGVTVVVGRNAHGKTNLLEALHRVATGTSHRVGGDVPLVRDGEDAAHIRVGLRTDEGRERTVELELRPGTGTRARVDGQDVRRSAEAVGVLRAVIVAPEDLAIVRGDPSERRRMLDDLLAQRRPAHAAARQEFERVLRQRNQLLKSARGLDGPLPTLETWTEAFVEHGASLVAARMAAVVALAGPASQTYLAIADEPGPVELVYRSSAGIDLAGAPDASVPSREEIAEALRHALAEVDKDERQRGITLVGPHRDDLDIAVRGLPARGYASHGQLWSLVLALRIASRELIAEVGDQPVVLLDDVFAELDEVRRERLAARCDEWDQVLITAAVDADVPAGGPRLEVEMTEAGSVVRPRGRP